MNRSDHPPIDPALDTYLRDAEAQLLDELCDWLRIPSVSTLPQHKEDVERAADWLARKMTAAGLENVELVRAGGHPIVYGDWLRAGPDAPTLLVYGHYDVQPADPLDLWTTPPFEPSVRGDDLFARGASDDKGQLFAHVAAVQALLATSGSLPVNVKFVVEGEEEDGSQALMGYVPAATQKLAADACLISDTHMLSPQQPLIIYGLRGMWAGEITVRGPARTCTAACSEGRYTIPTRPFASCWPGSTTKRPGLRSPASTTASNPLPRRSGPRSRACPTTTTRC